MNQVPEEKKDSVTKTLAILGFVAIIILIVWLAVKVVGLLPGAFSSLASIADSVYNKNTTEELTVTTQNSVVSSGEAFTASWSKLQSGGTYSFSYKCIEGVAVDVRRGSGDIQSVACDTPVDLGAATTVDVVVQAEKQRFTDVDYSITYHQDGVADKTADAIITIINATIPTGVVANDETTTDDSATTPTATEPETSAPSTPTTPVTTGEPVVVKKYIWQIPESDPRGYTDLQVTHLGVGVMDHGVFVPLPYLVEGEDGAVRFEVKNIGTKTSSRWSYEAELPGGIDYDSGRLEELKPNERVVVTLSFNDVRSRRHDTIEVHLDARNDVNDENDDYSWRVDVRD